MPEVPLWDLKVDGEPLPHPDETIDDRRPKLTPEQEMKLELPHLEKDKAWYDARKKEYRSFVRTKRHAQLKLEIETFLSSPDDVDVALKRIDAKTGPEAWYVLRQMFDRCTDEKIVNTFVERLWKPAAEWTLHEKHRDLTMREVQDMWKSLLPTVEPDEEARKPEADNPEFDRNYRFFRPQDEIEEDQ